jgi:hypothetical protein
MDASPFSKLPAEMRNRIYHMVLPQGKNYSVNQSPSSKGRLQSEPLVTAIFADDDTDTNDSETEDATTAHDTKTNDIDVDDTTLAPLHLCKAIRAECIKIFYHDNDFAVYLRRIKNYRSNHAKAVISPLRDFLKTVDPAHLSSFSSITAEYGNLSVYNDIDDDDGVDDGRIREYGHIITATWRLMRKLPVLPKLRIRINLLHTAHLIPPQHLGLGPVTFRADLNMNCPIYMQDPVHYFEVVPEFIENEALKRSTSLGGPALARFSSVLQTWQLLVQEQGAQIDEEEDQSDGEDDENLEEEGDEHEGEVGGEEDPRGKSDQEDGDDEDDQ